MSIGQPVDILDLSAALAASGRIERGVLRAGKGPAEEVEIPVAVVAGTRRGPTAWVNGSIHGDEVLGTAAIVQLWHRLDPVGISGRLILTPILNGPAFRAMQRTNPADDVDLNRIWDAAVDPSPTARIRDAVASEVLPRCDLVVDLHSGGNRYMQETFVVYPRVGREVDERSVALAKACGIPLLWAHRGSILEGSLIAAAARRGKPAVLVEVGGEMRADEPDVTRVLRAVRGCLAHGRLLPGRPRPLSTYRVFEGFEIVRNRPGGLWERLLEPGADVAKGDPLGRVTDPFGEVREVVVSPVDGIVLGICTSGAVTPDDTIAEIGHRIRLVRGRA